MKTKLSLLVLLCCVVCRPQSVDYRQTYIKPGYGVNFDLVDHVVTDGGTSFYTHTWALPWPTVSITSMPFFNCSLAIDWRKRCTSVNSYIKESNDFAYELLELSARFLKTCKNQLPQRATKSFYER